MISSLIWLFLIYIGFINPDKAPWKIYIPAVLLETIILFVLLPKVCDYLDKRREER